MFSDPGTANSERAQRERELTNAPGPPATLCQSGAIDTFRAFAVSQVVRSACEGRTLSLSLLPNKDIQIV